MDRETDRAVPPAQAPSGASPFPREFSIYLDLARFLAACLVVLYHSCFESYHLISNPLPFARYGHEAVIVFFVLSGFVIAYVTDTKERTLKEYWASRLSRIYSVALPAVLVSLLLDSFGEWVSPAYYVGKTTHDLWYVRLPASLMFLNETWGVSISPWSNTPYWSLSYEMWFYALFSIGFFLRGRTRTVLLVAVGALLGPKILLLAPIWWLGVALYRWRGAERWPEWTGWANVAASVFLAWGIVRFELLNALSERVRDWIGADLHKKLVWSDLFLGDYLLGGVVFLNFLGMRRVAHRLRAPLLAIASPIKTLSGYTFSIYIFHLPLLFFWAVLIPGSPDGYVYYAAVVGATAAGIWVLGRVTEQRRAPLRRALLSWFDRLEASPLPRLPARRKGLSQTASACSPGQSVPNRLVYPSGTS